MGAPTEVEKPASLAARLAAIFSRHSVALVSLMVALSGLAYNTWRNETTEAQRSTRQAAFRMLEELGDNARAAEALRLSLDINPHQQDAIDAAARLDAADTGTDI